MTTNTINQDTAGFSVCHESCVQCVVLWHNVKDLRVEQQAYTESAHYNYLTSFIHIQSSVLFPHRNPYIVDTWQEKYEHDTSDAAEN